MSIALFLSPQSNSKRVRFADGQLAQSISENSPAPRDNYLIISTLVQKYISSVFKKLNWHEEAVRPAFNLCWSCLVLICQTSFTDSTPIGNVEFTNLAYTFDPTAPRRVILAAHFDSKWFPDFPQNQVSRRVTLQLRL